MSSSTALVAISKKGAELALALAELTGENSFAPGEESLDVRLFEEHQIPWKEIAFRVIHLTLERYLLERKSGKFSVAVEDTIYREWRMRGRSGGLRPSLPIGTAAAGRRRRRGRSG